MSEPKPVTLEGVTYPSRAAAAKALGISEPAVLYRLQHEEPGKKWKTRRSIPTTVDGVTYPSRLAASRATGVSYDKLR